MAELKHIIRIGNVDLKGAKALYHQLIAIPGVGSSYSAMICHFLGINKEKKAGELSDEQAKKIDQAISHPETIGAPSWMFNRRKDPETGKDVHLISNDLKFVQSNDIKMMRKIKSYKGVRHSYGLPVRGQKTKSNFRKNKGKATGVVKKAKEA